MRTVILFVVVGALAGCAATGPAQVAQADCKVVPGTTKGAVGKPGTYSELDRKWAEAKLRGSDVRQNSFDRAGLNSPIEQALDDCARR